MDEHDDDLASEVIEGEEVETDAFDAEDDDARTAEDQEDSEDDDSSTEDDSEI